MLIRKTQQPSTYPENQIHDAYSTSATDTYSCNYINGIVESGSNTNGSWTKWADGTMICTGTVSGSSTMYDYWSQFKRTQEDITVSFPVEFINAPLVFITPYYRSGLITVLLGVARTNNFTFTGLKAIGNSAGSYSFSYQAIGKWK